MNNKANSEWKNKCSFLSPSGITHKIAGKDYTFYPISVQMAFRLRTMGSKMMAAFGALFVDTSADVGSHNRIVSDSQGSAVNEITVDPIDPRLAEIRAEHKQKAFQSLFDAIVNDDNKEILAEVVMDSLKDVFGEGARPSPDEFLADVPLPVFTEMLIGVFKANKGVLGPLGEAATDLLNKLVEDGTQKAVEKMTVREDKTPDTPQNRFG